MNDIAKKRKIIMILLFACGVINYLDRSALSISAGHIAGEFALSSSEMGWRCFYEFTGRYHSTAGGSGGEGAAAAGSVSAGQSGLRPPVSCPDGPLCRRSAFAKRAFGAGGPPRSHQLPPQALLFSGRRPAGSGFGQYRRFTGPVNLEKSVELWYF